MRLKSRGDTMQDGRGGRAPKREKEEQTHECRGVGEGKVSESGNAEY